MQQQHFHSNKPLFSYGSQSLTKAGHMRSHAIWESPPSIVDGEQDGRKKVSK
jgi:hypothetical protein